MGNTKNDLARQDFMYFFKKGLVTIDNQDPMFPGGCAKPFPAEKAHIKWYLSKLNQYRSNNIWVYKARDLVTTKSNLGWCLNSVLFETAPEIAIHRKTDRDTMFLLDEINDMYLNIPNDWFEDLDKLVDYTASDRMIKAVTREGTAAGIIFGASSKGNVLQGHNPNTFFWDEFEEDRYSDKILHATIGSGRKMLQIIGVSNPNGKRTPMYNYIFSEGKEELETPRYNDDTGELVYPVDVETREKFWLKEEIPGCWIGINRHGDIVIMMHFSADPDRRADSELRWRDNVTGAMVNWFEKYFLLTPRNIRARQYNLSFETSSDRPCFPEFNPDFHVVKMNPILRDKILHIGLDLGEQNPACVLFQFDDDQRCLIHDELPPPWRSFNDFMQNLSGLLGEKYSGIPVIVHPDPTGGYNTGADYFSIIRDLYNLEMRPPQLVTDQRFKLRIIQQYLRQVAKGLPMLCISKHCTCLIDGFTHGYKMKQDKYGNIGDQPMKDGFYDHLFDGLFYGIIASGYDLPVPRGYANVDGADANDPLVKAKRDMVARLNQQTGSRRSYAR